MSRDRLSINLEADDTGAHIFRLGGDLDVATAPALRGALGEAAADGKHELIVDLLPSRVLGFDGVGRAHRCEQARSGERRRSPAGRRRRTDLTSAPDHRFAWCLPGLSYHRGGAR